MRSTIISASCVLVFVLAICILSVMLLNHVISETDKMRVEILDCMEGGRYEEVAVQIANMATMWQKHEPTLEIVAQHEDLHSIATLIVEAKANYDAGDYDDFNRSMALLGESLSHLAAEERLNLSNIL